MAVRSSLLGRHYSTTIGGWNSCFGEEAALESLVLVSYCNRICHWWLLGYRGWSLWRMGVDMANRIIKMLYGIQQDKMLHFVGGLLFSQLLYAIASLMLPKWVALLLALIVATVVAALKEVWDIKHGVPSWADFLASEIGIMTGLSIMTLV